MAEQQQEKYPKRVMIQEIVDFFHLEQITGNPDSLNRWVVIPDINRPGFELSGYYEPTEPRRVVIIGSKEINYIKNLSDEEQRRRYQQITDGLTPMIIVTRGNPVPPVLVEVAQSRNFPIFRTEMPTYQFMVDLITFLDERLALEQSMSGELVIVYGKGILLTGESGMGKSETALELIRDGQVLVSDDRVDLQKIHNTIVGHAPAILKGMMEIRGIGIVDIERMFGANCLADKGTVDLRIHLVKYDPSMEIERIGDEGPKYTTIMGVSVPTIELPVSSGRSISTLVEAAVMNFLLEQEGYDSAKVFKERLHVLLNQNKEQQG